MGNETEIGLTQRGRRATSWVRMLQNFVTSLALARQEEMNAATMRRLGASTETAKTRSEGDAILAPTTQEGRLVMTRRAPREVERERGSPGGLVDLSSSVKALAIFLRACQHVRIKVLFLRELISNSFDTLDPICYESITDSEKIEPCAPRSSADLRIGEDRALCTSWDVSSAGVEKRARNRKRKGGYRPVWRQRA